MDLRSLQKPLKDLYRTEPNASQITLRAKGGQTDVPVSCSVDIGRAVYHAEAHNGVGGAGSGACSGDLLLGALAACAQITCQMVAAAMAIPMERIEVMVEGALDLRGTLGVSKDVPVGFENIQIRFDIAAPNATPEQLRALQEKTEQYCVVMQTLMQPPKVQTEWVRHDPRAPKPRDFIQALDSLAVSSKSADALMQGIVALLHEKLTRYNWVGFYMLEKEGDHDVLVLGPFKGAATPHTHIPLNQGICGAAASTGKTVVVDDVNSDPRYLACSLETKSEIVVPVFVRGKVVGELDIDSHSPAAFGAGDRAICEHAAAVLGQFLERHA